MIARSCWFDPSPGHHPSTQDLLLARALLCLTQQCADIASATQKSDTQKTQRRKGGKNTARQRESSTLTYLNPTQPCCTTHHAHCNPQSLICCRAVDVELAGRLVLHDVDFEVMPAKIQLFVGPNGGGKTSLFRLLLGLIAPTRGEIAWRAPGAIASTKPFPMGYVAQRTRADFRYPVSVRDVVSMVRRTPKAAIDIAIVDDALSRMALLALADRPISELSGGQQQRVLLARALAMQAPVIFLDEPTTGLDVQSQEKLLELLVELRDQKQTAILLSTHHPGPALAIADLGFIVHRTVTPVQLDALDDHHPGPRSHAESTHAHHGDARATPCTAHRTPPAPTEKLA